MGISILETYFWMIFGCVCASLPWGLAGDFVFGIAFGAYMFCYASRAMGESVLEVKLGVVFGDAGVVSPELGPHSSIMGHMAEVDPKMVPTVPT